MSRWRQRVEDLLYDGETVRETVDVETARVVVTSHRVLAFTPERDGENFQQADGPNVVGVETGTAGGRSWLRRAISAAILGGFFLVVGLLVDFGSLFEGPDVDREGTQQVGGEGIVDGMETVLDLLAHLDVLLQLVGVFWLVMAAALARIYWTRERDPALIIRVAGERPDIYLPRPEDVETTRSRLERAILPEPPVASGVDVESGVDDDLLGEETGRTGDDSLPDEDTVATGDTTSTEGDDDPDSTVWPDR